MQLNFTKQDSGGELTPRGSRTQTRRTNAVEIHHPQGPSSRGRWERMVGSTKQALKAYTSSRVSKEDNFRTVLARAADVPNSRPLLLRSQGELSDPLTPDHYLNPRVRDLDVNTDFRIGLQKVNEKVKAATKELWELFTRDLPTQNQNRQTWGKEELLPQKGDLTLLLEISTRSRRIKLARGNHQRCS